MRKKKKDGYAEKEAVGKERSRLNRKFGKAEDRTIEGYRNKRFLSSSGRESKVIVDPKSTKLHWGALRKG